MENTGDVSENRSESTATFSMAAGYSSKIQGAGEIQMAEDSFEIARKAFFGTGKSTLGPGVSPGDTLTRDEPPETAGNSARKPLESKGSDAGSVPSH